MHVCENAAQIFELFHWQIVPDNQQRLFELHYVLRFWFQLTELVQHGSPHAVVQWVKVWIVRWPGAFVNEVWAVFAEPFLHHLCCVYQSNI